VTIPPPAAYVRPMRLVSFLLALAAVLGAGGAAARPAAQRCPTGLLPLTGTNPIAGATTAALRSVRPADRPQVTGAVLAAQDPQRGPQAATLCGKRARGRTVVVYVTARALLPAQSAAQRVFFVGRFESGYRVWYVVR